MKIIIPMAGLGSRFKNVGIDRPKPLIHVDGITLIEHSVNSLGIDGDYIFITRKYDNEEYNKELSQILKTLKPNSIEIMLDHDQDGAADAALYAKDYIDNDDELIITNCDQLLFWDSDAFLSKARNSNADGAIVTFESDNPKNSFAIVKNGLVTTIKEKQVISNTALIGVHYWKHGKLFVRSAKLLLSEYRQKGMAECYVSSTYQYLIDDNYKVITFDMPEHGYISLGTPDDVKTYLGQKNEFYSDKPKTIFCDIDGTILKHAHKFSSISLDTTESLPGVVDKFNEWDSRGHKIILVTARKESARLITEQQLSLMGIPFDYLIMGVTSGKRILINDKYRSTDDDRAIAVNVLTDQGFNSTEWYNIGL